MPQNYLPQPIPTIQIGHLYPHELNLYGDRGNLVTLTKRAQWRGIETQITPIHVGDSPDWQALDFVLMGGGQDAQQLKIAQDLPRHRDAIQAAVAQGLVFLGICGGYQLMGHYYQPHEGPRLEGLSILDVTTVAGSTRMIGNLSLQRPSNDSLVGFENHSGLTTLGENARPLGHVLTGSGNNGKDQGEGAVQGTCYGTYLHGSLLPKNPQLADELLALALRHAYARGGVDVTLTDIQSGLTPLDDALEAAAHAIALGLKG